jgi:N-acetyltransferase
MIWPPADEPLVGPIVLLEPLRERHRGPLLEVSREPATWEWIDRRVPGDEDAFSSWFDERLEGRRTGSEWPFATVLAETGRAIGSSSYLAPRPRHDGVEIGWTWLHPDAWRTGANRAAKLLMLENAFAAMGAMRVEFKTDARNQRSRAAIEALGARFEGIRRKDMLMPVVGVRDSAYFSICDDEWPALSERLRGQVGAEPGSAA